MLLPHWLLAVLGLSPLVLVARTGQDALRQAPAEAPAGDVASLVRRIQGGDPAAESELVSRFSRGLLLMLRRLVQGLHGPAEAGQDLALLSQSGGLADAVSALALQGERPGVLALNRLVS